MLESELTDEPLAQITDPAALLARAWVLEPWMQFNERAAVLDRLEQVLGDDGVPRPPPGRDWELELLAERAVDVGRQWRLEEAQALVARVLHDADPSHEIALGRAMLARGQALAWVGTDEAARGARRAFTEAAERFAALGHDDWRGSALLRCGYSACYQHGDLVAAEAMIREALEAYPPDSERRAGALGYYADVLVDLGEFDRAQTALEQAIALAESHPDPTGLTEFTWGLARVAAGRGDARATERLLREAERGETDKEWFETHIGLSYLLESAELLDRVGLDDRARAQLERARTRAGEAHEEVMQTAAVLCARSGDPWLALELLQELARGDWLEKRTIWRHTLMTAWATFRAGRGGAGAIAAQALQRAVASGSVRIAQAGEPDLVAALAPLAEAAGSEVARALLLDGRAVLVRVFGTPAVTGADGTPLALPAGKPGELVRMLALHEHGLTVDAVLEAFFPDTPPATGRHRLRQVLTRLRASAGELIVRDGDNLRLVPAWVDVREFWSASERVRAARGARATQLAYGALALRGGPLLPNDPYAAWAERARDRDEYRHLELLDLVAADASARGSHQEALTALEAALAEDPDDEDRRAAMAEHQVALHRHRAARHLRGEPAQGEEAGSG